MKLTKTVKQIAILNVLIFILAYMTDFSFYDQFALFPDSGQPYQYITHMFLHAGFAHILFNMLAFLSFGSDVENYFGRNKFILFYLISGIGAALLYIILTGSQSPMVGASGAIFGVLAASAIIRPEQKFYIFFILPVKAKWIIPLLIIVELYLGISYPDGKVAHFAHIGGAVTGVLFYLGNKFIKK